MLFKTKTETETYTDRGEHWDSDAACEPLMRGDPVTFDEYFYPETFHDQSVTKMARRICMACPVRLECLQDALDNHDMHGLKGGLTPQQRLNHLKLPLIPRQREAGHADA